MAPNIYIEMYLFLQIHELLLLRTSMLTTLSSTSPLQNSPVPPRFISADCLHNISPWMACPPLKRNMAETERLAFPPNLPLLAHLPFHSIRSLLLKSPIHALVISPLDYSNLLLLAIHSHLDPVISIQNSIAKFISLLHQYVHMMQFFTFLHWLPLHSYVQYKLLVLTFSHPSLCSPFNFLPLFPSVLL